MPIISTLIGGILSLVGAFGATVVANRHAARAKVEESERLSAELAYGTIHKLLNGFNLASNLKRQIDEMFDAARDDGREKMEPWAKVTQITGGFENIELIHSSETRFLLDGSKASLMNEIHLVQLRLSSVMRSAQKYNDLRGEFQSFLEEHVTEAQLGSGNQMAGSIKGQMRVRAATSEGRLNSLLGQIMESLDQDTKRSWVALQDFRLAAIDRFGDKLPKFVLSASGH
jgi:hypothetical protein